jgi:uncharacterized protein (TIGR03083 family)
MISRPLTVEHGMTELVDRSIAALRARHDELETLVSKLTPEELDTRSGASEWTVAHVLSHLGSAAEIMLSTISEAAGITVAPKENKDVWDRWNAASPDEQASGFLEHDERLVAALEGTSEEQRQTAMIELGFLPEPVHLVTPVGMRLNEVAAHGWDVAVAVDPDAAIDAETADLLLQHFTGGLGFLLGFAGTADRLSADATIAVGDYQLVVDDSVRIVGGSEAPATATFAGPLEAVIRLLSGRLAPEHTPADVEVSGNVTLDDLRNVFPGY